MKKYLLQTISVISLFLLITICYGASSSIGGRISDAKTGLPIVNAKLSIQYSTMTTSSDKNGIFSFDNVKAGTYNITCSKAGYISRTKMKINVVTGKDTLVNFSMRLSGKKKVKVELKEAESLQVYDKSMPRRPMKMRMYKKSMNSSRIGSRRSFGPRENHPGHNTEQYNLIKDNEFLSTQKNPLSTFSIDVDTASYSNVRRIIGEGKLPPVDAVRIEELLNYFNYDYPNPKGEHPFSVYTEISKCPWNTDHKLVHIGIQGKKIETSNLPPSNLVFLLDVSGSMNSADKLPLLKSSFKLLVKSMQPSDTVAIVVYAGSSGTVLKPTPASDSATIIAALDKLRAGGSTAGGAGIELAYKLCKENFLKAGNNRVILATDGDFNVGISSQGALIRLIEKKREEGIFLTVLGFGRGNIKDSTMEQIANKGNGNYAYIDSVLEAKKVLVKEMGGTLVTIVKDVKIQVEFNPSKVKGYRLIGYVNRKLANEDFNNDKKDAGELGSGHSVTVLYELVPASSAEKLPDVDELKYQKLIHDPDAKTVDELLTVKFR
ncbi:von Willebrand factor type A domain-containing protein, partial [bacterium]|nr:von Willebrand factor type A domain-containing protein [bacterium]